MSPDSLLLTLTTKPLVHINCWEKTVYDSSYYATCTSAPISSHYYFALHGVPIWQLFQPVRKLNS